MVAVYVVISYTEKVGAALAPSESPLGSRGGLPGEGGLLGEGETPGARLFGVQVLAGHSRHSQG